MKSSIIAGEYALTTERFNTLSDQLAQAIYASGVREGDVIAIFMRNRMQYLQLIEACKKLGIYYCPINWHFTADEVSFIVADSGAKILFTESDLILSVVHALKDSLPIVCVSPVTEPPNALSALDLPKRSNVHDFEYWRAQHPPYAGPVVSPRGHMAYTSGTTGRPKGVVRFAVPLDKLGAQQKFMQEVVIHALGLHTGCKALLPAPIYHSGPSIFTQVSLRVCETFVVMPRFDPEEVLKLIAQHQIDVVYLVPIMYVRLLKLPTAIKNKYNLSSLKFVASTGSPCPPEIKRQMIDWFGPIIYETYASSEAGMITGISSSEALRKPGSAGRPIGQGVIRILDRDGHACPPNQPGKIYVHQPAYADFTYRNNPDARQKIEHDGLITLGDIGYLDEEGYLFVCDRESDMVISGGVNIYPAEIENELMTHPEIADCGVVGVPDDEYGEKLLAFIQPANASHTLSADKLMDWLKPKIAGYKIPREFRFQSDLPRDDSGKIVKRKLRQPFWEKSQRKV
jgi:long-chain acyl-CoA synthetase